MKFKTRDIEGDLITGVLETRGIDDVREFISPNIDTKDINITNFNKANEMFYSVKKYGSNIGILVDSDADGYCSSAMLMHFLGDVGLKIFPIIPEAKQHGLEANLELVEEQVSRLNIDLLLLPDSSVNDTKAMESMDCNVVVIDHHIIENENSSVYKKSNIAIISNQWENSEINRNYTGAGMVMKVIEKLSKEWDYEDYFDVEHTLEAIGQIADASDISDLTIRQEMLQGLNDVSGKLVETFFGVDTPTPHDLSFTIIPRINAITRIGNIGQREDLLYALAELSGDDKVPVMKRKKNPSTGKFRQIELMQTHYEVVHDMMNSVKTKQDNYVKKIVDSITTTVHDSFTVSIINPDDNKYPSVTGLIANKFINLYQKPSLVLFENDGVYNGSGRGFEKVMPNFKEYCDNSGAFIFAQGHENAFGVSIDTKGLEMLDEMPNIETNEPTYIVDKLYTQNTYNLKADVQSIIDNMMLFGGKVTEPTLGFKQLDIPKKSIRVRGSMFTALVDGMTFVCYNNNEFINEIKKGFNPVITVNILGRANENNWGGKLTNQIVCENIEMTMKENKQPVTFGFDF